MARLTLHHPRRTGTKSLCLFLVVLMVLALSSSVSIAVGPTTTSRLNFIDSNGDPTAVVQQFGPNRLTLRRLRTLLERAATLARQFASLMENHGMNDPAVHVLDLVIDGVSAQIGELVPEEPRYGIIASPGGIANTTATLRSFDTAGNETASFDIELVADNSADAIVAVPQSTFPRDISNPRGFVFVPTEVDGTLVVDAPGFIIQGEANVGPPSLPCDVDGDGDVDRDDIATIVAARGPASGPDDPRDVDGDGIITVLDARRCVLECTHPGCAALR